MTILTKKQEKVTSPAYYTEGGISKRITAKLAYDDDCNNGHNTFSITAYVQELHYSSWVMRESGCLHKEVVQYFPQLAHLIKWHSTSSDGPLHYIENTMFWLGYRGWCNGKLNSPPNLQFARETAVWPDLPESYVADYDADIYFSPEKLINRATEIDLNLKARLPELLAEFRKDMEALGFTY